ncbi:ethyl tert-butyl ether degradation protein EthD [Methylobacterium sp. Leaf456]|uniref:EthD family reductase n=1 Tax=Methylobacterium sp. Leaf456 TaxID=1736382 RepID=UPI0006F77AC8|nr:EthD family reductase [Methylobacterium sp. Leaf456]KQT57189.1 ethyl tert-butyl ether degradation protein EthD [Methylobacterium sp. Leaf456]
MVLISVMYPSDSGTRFDMDYYLKKHMPLVSQRWSSKGLHDYTVLKGAGTPDGGTAPYQVVANLRFDSADAFKRAAGEDGEEIFGDIPNFTDSQPVVQISDFAE